jgi:chitinase
MRLPRAHIPSLGCGLILLLCGACRMHGSEPLVAQASSGFWVTAYYTVWGTCGLPPSAIDYSAVTHIVHQGIEPDPSYSSKTSDGLIVKYWRLPEPAEGWSGQAYFERGVGSGCEAYPLQADLIERAHANGVKVVLGLGGSWGNADKMAAIAGNPAKQREYVSSILNYAQQRGYDGVDMDWEFVQARDRQNFVALMQALYDALQQWKPRGLLTIAIPGWTNRDYGYDYPTINRLCDQINMMNYDMYGPTWSKTTYHHAALYKMSCGDGESGNVHNGIQDVLAAGADKGKLGLGIPFYGYITWKNTGPCQKRGGWGQQVSYSQVLGWKNPQNARWDEAGKVPYLSDVNFVVYDDERSVAEKVHYARSNKLGGVMVFELWRGLVDQNPEGSRQPLLDAVKRAVKR